MSNIIRCLLEREGTINDKYSNIFQNIFHTVHFSVKSWISLKSAQVYYALLLGLLTIFVNGCANLQTALFTPETYHFRKVRWGSTKASVMLSEQGKRIHFNSGNTLVYKHRHKDVPILLIYCFQDNRLRTAGYLTANPAMLKDPDQLFRQGLLETLGEPTETLPDGGMLWKSDETLTYTNTYLMGTSRIDFSRIHGNLLSKNSVLSTRSTTSNGRLENWHGVCAYIDMNFYHKLSTEGLSPFVLAELSYYEEIMFGLFRETWRKD